VIFPTSSSLRTSVKHFVKLHKECNHVTKELSTTSGLVFWRKDVRHSLKNSLRVLVSWIFSLWPLAGLKSIRTEAYNTSICEGMAKL
jgi:hypothetical protein